MTATTKPRLVDQFGRPMASGRLYPTTRYAPNHFKPRRWLTGLFREDFNSYDRTEQLNWSRQLFAQCPNLGTAILDKNQWAFGDGWEPHYTGANTRWGDEATAFLREQFLPNCDVNGQHDWLTCLYLSGIAWDRDGEDLMVLTEDKNGSGFPKVQFISAARIGSGSVVDGKPVVGGPWDGYRIWDGVILDDNGTPVAVRVQGESSDPEDYEDFTLGFGGTADLAYPPEWSDQCRGIPLIARPSLDWLNLRDIDEFMQRGLKRAASIGLITKTKDGEPPLANPIEEDTTDYNGVATHVYYEEIQGGEGYFLKSDGEAIEGLKYENPHPNVEAFIQRMERRAIRAVGWSYELIYLAESGRAATRLVCDLGNQSIWKQQKLGLKRTWRAVRYALAKAMKNGFLSRNPDPRDAYFRWDFGLPAELSVDAGNDEQADRENLKMGTTNKALIAQKRGRYWLEVTRQRKVEIIQNAKDAAEIEAATAGKVPFDKAFELLEQRAANPTAQAPTAEPEPEPPNNLQK